MIQPAAPTSASASLQPSGAPAGNGGQGAESGNFADILGGQQADPGSGYTRSDPAAGASPLALVRTGPDATLPLAGKILPGALPGAVSDAQPDAGAPADPAAAPGQTIPTLLAALRTIRLPLAAAGTARSSGQGTDTKTPAAPNGADDTVTDDIPGTGLAALATGAAPAAAAAASTTGDAGLAPLVAAQLHGRPLTLPGAQPAQAAATDPAQTATAKTDTQTLKLDPARIDPTATAGLVFDAGAAKPMTGVRLRPVLASDNDSKLGPAAIDAPTDSAGLLANPLGQALSGTADPSAPGIAPGAQPRDFAALMDRLISARDAAQTGLPQSVHVAVNHAEFGSISLNFQHDKGGLAVSLASADPDFARAVQAGIPAAAAAASADSATRDSNSGSASQGWSGGRGEMTAAGGDAGQRSARQNGNFTADDSTPSANPAATTEAELSARPRGIFA